MKLSKLLVVVLAVLVAAPVMGSDAVSETIPLPTDVHQVKRAIIKAMIDPPGSFSVTYWTADFSSQCPINPGWTITVTQRSDVDGTYIRGGCPHKDPTPCFCDIYVRSSDTKRAWENMLEPYQQEHTATLPLDPSSSARVQSSSLTYYTAAWRESPVGPTVVDLSAGKIIDVTRGNDFNFTVDAFVPAGAQSPCADPKGRPCRLTTDLWQVLPDGSRKMLMWSFEIGGAGKVWIEPGTPEQVSLEGIFPHPNSYRHIPKGKAVLVAKWFLWKSYWSLADYQVPVGGFEVPLNIR